ncbi:ferrochelatase-2, chloroplastic [Cucurbita moschata]|uniref:Ferrochelatase n=1 Tax=Cucurbita moschata TaxID=3662 RepID=A0A6J1G6H7_CUCMO|nr:ferrochelatase-2, chloroplastic [Cucurbita moschata]XP_022947334.1 ferrochelatase-2, chloroplastic [Cucurbita moschata]XP_022947335.1 ferrochelatase-2, chloroplastic [Cucurbita moschata]
MDSAIQASPSPASSSAFRSPCLTSASQNCKFPLPTSRVSASSKRMHRGFRLHMDASPNYNISKNHVVSKYSSEWPESQSIFSKQSLNKYFSPLRALVASNTQDIPATPLTGDDKVGVLLLNLGGPETLDDVQPFLFNLFADPDIIRLPRLFRFLQRPLAHFISVLRSPKSREGYASIGGGSPLRKITDAQAEELKKALWQKDVPAEVYVGMRYWHPFTEEAIEQIKKDRITKLVVLPLYPQFSISTSGSSLRLLEGIFREDEYLVNMQHTVIPSWYQREGYIKAMADLIEKELKSFDFPEQVMVFFSAHGVPLAYVEEAGDPYKAEMEECVDLIMEELEKRRITNNYTLAYQSRVGPVEWLKPYTDDTIIELGQKGVKSLLAVPISFVSEHIETLEEIDVEYKELALKSGVEKWGRVPALGCEPTFITDLADAVIESLPYVGAMAVSNLEARQPLVPLGSVEELLAAYDSQRRQLPPPVTVWEWGWTKSAETWNGRAAMLAVLVLLVLEVTTGEGFLHQWGVFPLFHQ